MNNWYVITGGPCAGKTTTINELEKRGYRISHEQARRYFEQELAKGRDIHEIRSNPIGVQESILQMKLAIEADLPKDELVFLDRGVPDTRGYLRYQNVSETDMVREALEKCSYKAVFLLDPLPLELDEVRTETPEEQKAVHDVIGQAYSSLGLTVIPVPVMPIGERVDFILNSI